MIINNNFSMRAICIGGILGLLVAVSANHLMPKSNAQSQPAYPNSKIEKTVPAFVVSNSNPLLHLKTTTLKAVSDAQEFIRMIGRNEHVDQMIIMDALAKSIKKESNHSEPHSGLANEPPLALKGTLRPATTAEVLYTKAQELIQTQEVAPAPNFEKIDMQESTVNIPHSGLQFGILLKDYAEEKLIREIKNYARLTEIMQEVEQMRKEISWRR